MKKVLVIGIGSRVMADDAIGICLVEDLKELDTNSDIRYLAGETDIDYCMWEVAGYDYLVIIDAFLSGKQPGEVTVVPLNELDNGKKSALYSMHGAHFLDTLRYSVNLPDGIFIGIEPYEINYGFSLSDRLQSCYEHIIKEVHSLLETILTY